MIFIIIERKKERWKCQYILNAMGSPHNQWNNVTKYSKPQYACMHVSGSSLVEIVWHIFARVSQHGTLFTKFKSHLNEKWDIANFVVYTIKILYTTCPKAIINKKIKVSTHLESQKCLIQIVFYVQQIKDNWIRKGTISFYWYHYLAIYFKIPTHKFNKL